MISICFIYFGVLLFFSLMLFLMSVGFMIIN